MGENITLLYIIVQLFPLILCFICAPFSLINIIIGIVNIKSCPVQTLIPIWILVVGIILLIPTAIACLTVIPCKTPYLNKSDEKENQRSILRVLYFVGLLLAVWSIMGSIWSLRIHRRDSSNTSTPSTADCRSWLVKFVLVSSMMKQMNPQQQEVPLQTLNSDVDPHQGPMVNEMTPSVSLPPSGNDQSWKHLLTNIPRDVSNKLTIIGVLYIIFGLLIIILELVLIFRGISFFGAFVIRILLFSFFGASVNGVLLIIAGVVTLVLCRQQIYTLTSLFVLLIVQLHTTIVVLGFYTYLTVSSFQDLSICSDTSYYSCSSLTTAAVIAIVYLIHFLFTIGLTIGTLIIIINARRLPIIPVVFNYASNNP